MDPSIEIVKASDGTANASLATIQSVRAPAATTIDVDTVAGINPAGFVGSMGTPHTFTDPATSETITVIDEATAVDFIGHVDGTNLEIDEIAPGYTDGGSEIGDIVVIRPTTQYGDKLAELLEVVHEDDGTLKADIAPGGVPLDSVPFNAPQGFLINGKIVTSVATNDLTVAIKALDGTNPSATNPVHVRIGNTLRTITSALSVTKNDGTNWFNSGAASTATLELDYFVYLGYNVTDGVVIGFSRIPYARVYGDFSATTTNDKYAAISNITTAASTDEYENIGRFNAILSATAAFTWSIPATSIVISRPIFETRWLPFAPQIAGLTVGNGSFGNSRLRIRGQDASVKIFFTCGGSSDVSASLIPTLPVVTSNNYATFTQLGNAIYQDVGSNAYMGAIYWNTTTTAAAVAMSAAGTYVSQFVWTTTTPFDTAAGDTFSFQMDYEL